MAILKKNDCVSVKNFDDQRLKWAVLSALINNVSEYKKYEIELKFKI